MRVARVMTKNVMSIRSDATIFEAAERLVYWTPTARSGAAAYESRPPCFLLASGESTLQMLRSTPALLRRQLADLNHYNAEFRALTEAGRLCDRLGMSVNVSCKTGESSIACAAALHAAAVMPNIAWAARKPDSSLKSPLMISWLAPRPLASSASR